MAILTGTFTSWSKARSKLTQYNHLSPNVQAIRDYLLANYPNTKNLGGYVVRSVRGGSSLSTHAFGAANDVGFDDRAVERQMVEFLVNHSAELGIQGVHCYGSCGLSTAGGIGYIWRSSRSDPGDASVGWRKQKKKGGMGETWAKWIHFEVHEGVWGDGRPVEVRVAGASTPAASGATAPVVTEPKPDWPPFDPANGQFGLWPLSTSKPKIQWKDPSVDANEREATKYLQGVFKKAGLEVEVNGDFGPTENHYVCFHQEQWGLEVDGIVGTDTWSKVDAMA